MLTVSGTLKPSSELHSTRHACGAETHTQAKYPRTRTKEVKFKKQKGKKPSQTWWHVPSIPALGRQILEF